MSLGVTGVTLRVPRVYLLDKRCCVLYAARKTLATPMAEFSLCHVEPTPMFWRIMSLSFISYAFRLRGNKCFIKRGFGVGMPIVHHQANLLHVRIILVNQGLDKMCPITFCPLLTDCGIPLPSPWLKSDKNVCRPIALILCVIPQWLAGCSGERSTDFPNQLGRHCGHTPLGTLRIIRLFRDISDVLHVTDEGGILR
jgi:hypothetical protein